MNVDNFTRQVEVVHKRLIKLYEEGGSALPFSGELEPTSNVAPLLPIAFRELGTASEELQVAVEELRQQNEELAAARVAVEAERQRYQDLFEFAPDAYLVTDTNGTIRFANRAAAALLNVTQHSLAGKPITSFVGRTERQNFRTKLTWLLQQVSRLNDSTANGSFSSRRQKWEVQLQPRHSGPLNATLTVAANREANDNTVTFRWLLHDVTEHRQTETVLETSAADPGSHYTIHHYSKGETIPLDTQVIWQVRQGLVKLSTFCEARDEILVGLVKPSMLFGPSMTSLQTFQATALSEVQLACLPLTEIAVSLPLAQSLLPQINQRLRQTELLLAISGERRVEDRLHQLLRLLQQEIGQPVAQGTRLSIRLTHEDLANACCTTRVTITRLLSKLQRQEKLLFCSKRHIILKDGF